jgi:hypothetical protein
MTPAQIRTNPLIGQWLKKATIEHLKRPIEDALRDSRILRDIMIANLIKCYQSGQLIGPDVDIRLCNVMTMIGDIGNAVVAEWSRTASIHLKAMSQETDGGLSMVFDCIEAERAKGNDEMADLVEQISALTEEEIQNMFLNVSNSLEIKTNNIQ